MPKGSRYRTLYFSDMELLAKIEKWMRKNKVNVFNSAILSLVASGLGENKNNDAAISEFSGRLEKIERILGQQGYEL